MIERAARCLEIGGRAALRGHRRPFRSQRHLHSAFWSHGAGSIDLPAWWILLLQTSGRRDPLYSSGDREQDCKTNSTRLEDIFLDFLYPVQTLALIKRLKKSTTAHRHAAHNVKQYSRSYTSIATEFITGVKTTTTEHEAYSGASIDPHQDGEILKKTINELLDADNPTWTYDKLWQSYQDLLETSNSLSPQELLKLLRCLTLSKRRVDTERALALFESLRTEEREAIHYSHAVGAALALKDLPTAVLIRREALSRLNSNIGTTAILGFAVQHDQWNVAIETWHPLWKHKLSYYTRSDIWVTVDALPLDDLINKALVAADFSSKVSQSSDVREATAAREFAMELARRAFTISGSEYNIKRHWELVMKVNSFDDSDVSLGTLALKQLLLIDTNEHGHQALHLYRILRKTPTFSPSREILGNVTQRLLVVNSTSGLSMVIDDWRRLFSNLPYQVAVDAARAFARRGQIDAVEKLLDDLAREGGMRSSNRRLYMSLLFAHNRRADTKGILKCLDHLQEAYGFEPDLKVWNLVIGTFARIGDIDGALEYLEKLRDMGLQPNSDTYVHLLSMYGKRGDLDAVELLFEQSKGENVLTTVRMVNAIVLANVNDGRLEKAEQLVEDALKLNTDGPRTFMWNVLINAYALRNEVEKVSQLHTRMQRSAVLEDNMTYAALMTSLTAAKQPDSARKILDTVMPRKKIKPTALHYALLMRGYLETKQPSWLFQIYKQMLDAGLSPNMSTQNILLRAAAFLDKRSSSSDYNSEAQTDFVRAKQALDQTIQDLDPAELAPAEPHMFVGANPLNEAFSSSYFEYLIFLHGKESAFDKVADLYEQFKTTNLPLQDDKDIEASPPIRMLSALMVAHIRANNDSEVERCWKLALERSRPLACKSGAKFSRQSWVLPSRRFIMNPVFHHYMLFLANQNRISNLIDTVDDLHKAGFALHSSNWNRYIQSLARSDLPTHRSLAFQLCEQELIPGWQGWTYFGNPAYMGSKMQKRQRDMVLMRKEQKAPNYPTLIWLANAYLEAKRLGNVRAVRELEKMGPKTVDAIKQMPRLSDKLQSQILRQEV